MGAFCATFPADPKYERKKGHEGRGSEAATICETCPALQAAMLHSAIACNPWLLACESPDRGRA
eukprot:4852276-Alexandrium_andersonii.AAC.1